MRLKSLAVALLIVFVVGVSHANPKPYKGNHNHNNSHNVVAKSNSNSNSNAYVAGDNYDEYPVSSAAVQYAGYCTGVANVQGRNLGIGLGGMDRSCKLLMQAQAEHMHALSIRCPLPTTGKDASPWGDTEYAACARMRSESWTRGNMALDQNARELCARGLFKHVWAALWAGDTKCEMALQPATEPTPITQ